MIPILPPEHIRQADAHTLKQQKISSLALMDRACAAFVHAFLQHFPSPSRHYILCGKGNNGGDGLGIARLLREKHYDASPIVLESPQQASPDFDAQRKRLQAAKHPILVIRAIKDLTAFFKEQHLRPEDILLDALFGAGLSRPLGGIFAQAVRLVNSLPCRKVAVDMPAGLLCTQAQAQHPCVHADHVFSFEVPKLPFLLPSYEPFVKSWTLLDIGLDKAFLHRCPSPYHLLTPADIKPLLPALPKFMHKNKAGRSLLIAGSYGMMGAALLAAKAAMRTGTGVLKLHAPAAGYPIAQTALPEILVSSDKNPHYFTHLPLDINNFHAIAIGPGLGTHFPSANALRELLHAANKKPLIIDADALNILAEYPSLLPKLPKESILSPHLGEFQRLVGACQDDFQTLEKLENFATKHQVIVILKGAHSIVAEPHGKLYFNNTGNPGMATAGTGDVLTGMLLGLLAQQQTPLHAAQSAVFLHGLAGDLATKKIGQRSLIASDLIDALPHAFHTLETQPLP